MASILRNHAGQHRPVGAMAQWARTALSPLLLALTLFALAGCGLKGDLQPPEPPPTSEANPHATRT